MAAMAIAHRCVTPMVRVITTMTSCILCAHEFPLPQDISYVDRIVHLHGGGGHCTIHTEGRGSIDWQHSQQPTCLQLCSRKHAHIELVRQLRAQRAAKSLAAMTAVTAIRQQHVAFLKPAMAVMVTSVHPVTAMTARRVKAMQ